MSTSLRPEPDLINPPAISTRCVWEIRYTMALEKEVENLQASPSLRLSFMNTPLSHLCGRDKSR